MDNKNSYETYEFLPIEGTGSEGNQVYLIQNDATFLVNRQIQYVTQVQDVKQVLENVEQCTVFDVTPQQFFVDGSTELMSTDHFILPDAANNLYANSYLIQTVPDTATDNKINDASMADQLKELNSQENSETSSNKQTCNFTEITLTDDQCHMLEQKGWVLIETNDKVFVLNTLGLHDITSNNGLIQKFKSEIQDDTSIEISADAIKIRNTQNAIQDVIENQQDVTASINQNDVICEEEKNLKQEVNHSASNNKQVLEHPIQQQQDVEEQKLTVAVATSDQDDSIEKENDSIEKETLTKTQVHRKGNTVRIKINLESKDIPDKIVLGRTKNGKKLVAKLRKTKNNNRSVKNKIVPKNFSVYIPVDSNVSSKTAKTVHLNKASLTEAEFENLVGKTFLEADKVMCSDEDLNSACTMVTRLLQVPAFKPSLTERNLFITKVVNDEDESGKIQNESKTSLITGRVMSFDDNRLRFVQMPDMIQKLVASTDKDKEEFDENFLHVHTTETRSTDKSARTSITLTKRRFPAQLVLDKKSNAKAMFACSSCAAIFNTENDLTEHQETQCMETEDTLTIDTGNINKTAEIKCISNNRGIQNGYCCTICKSTFDRMSNCQRHMKIHLALVKPENEANTEYSSVPLLKENGKYFEAKYKCKMCASAYHHPTTLTKHIVTAHVTKSIKK